MTRLVRIATTLLLACGCDVPGGRGGGFVGEVGDVAEVLEISGDATDAEAEVTPATYTATQDRGGERCGSDGQDWVLCAPRDRCVDSEANRCEVVTGDYRAWLDGGGQRCGLNDLGTFHTYCVPRDKCVDQDAPIGICQLATGSQYPAYKSADGDACGEEGWFFVYCEPGNSCISLEDNLCE